MMHVVISQNHTESDKVSHCMRNTSLSPKKKRKNVRESPSYVEKERRKPGRKPGQGVYCCIEFVSGFVFRKSCLAFSFCHLLPWQCRFWFLSPPPPHPHCRYIVTWFNHQILTVIIMINLLSSPTPDGHYHNYSNHQLLTVIIMITSESLDICQHLTRLSSLPSSCEA